MKTVLLTLFMTCSAYAGTITCEYNFGNDSVSLGFAPHQQQTLERRFNMKGLRYVVHVENIKVPNEVDDYIIIENDKQHRITYALKCNKARSL